MARVKRVEIADEWGEVRAVLGSLDADVGEVGVALFSADADGTSRKRAALAVDDLGPDLNYRVGGNVVMQVGVVDPARDVVRPGPYVILTDWDGLGAVEFQVSPDGRVSLTGLGHPRP